MRTQGRFRQLTRSGNVCACTALSIRSLKCQTAVQTFFFFGLIAASLRAAAVLIGLLVAGDVAGPRVAMNHSPSHSQGAHRQ